MRIDFEVKSAQSSLFYTDDELIAGANQESQIMNVKPKRLRILAEEEIEVLYELPRFTPEERNKYFTLSWSETEVLEQLRSTKSRLHFILQLGYFKARYLFFVFDLPSVMEDVLYIREQHFPGFDLTNISITKVTRLRQQRLILELYNYRNCRAQERQQLETRAQQAARVDSKPIYIFRQLMHYLTEERIVSPAYSVMQDIGVFCTTPQKGIVRDRTTKTFYHSLVCNACVLSASAR